MEILIAGFLAFVSSNIDDLFILVLFYGNKSYGNRDIIIGQFLGIITLTAIGMAGSLVGFAGLPCTLQRSVDAIRIEKIRAYRNSFCIHFIRNIYFTWLRQWLNRRSGCEFLCVTKPGHANFVTLFKL